MSRRESVYVIRRTRYESPPSPNATVDQITTEVRIFFPPNATVQTMLKEVLDANVEVVEKLFAHFREDRRRRKEWLEEK